MAHGLQMMSEAKAVARRVVTEVVEDGVRTAFSSINRKIFRKVNGRGFKESELDLLCEEIKSELLQLLRSEARRQFNPDRMRRVIDEIG